MRDDKQEEENDSGPYFLTCDVCGAEEEEDKADETWVSFGKCDAFEVLVCDECAESEEKLQDGFQIFLTALAANKRETML